MINTAQNNSIDALELLQIYETEDVTGITGAPSTPTLITLGANYRMGDKDFEVYVNGIRLKRSEITLGPPNTVEVTLPFAIAADDVFTVIGVRA